MPSSSGYSPPRDWTPRAPALQIKPFFTIWATKEAWMIHKCAPDIFLFKKLSLIWLWVWLWVLLGDLYTSSAFSIPRPLGPYWTSFIILIVENNSENIFKKLTASTMIKISIFNKFLNLRNWFKHKERIEFLILKRVKVKIIKFTYDEEVQMSYFLTHYDF